MGLRCKSARLIMVWLSDMQTLEILETQTIFTPLGIRCWDPVYDRQVGEGLQVTARPETASGPVKYAFRTATRVYAFQNLPGLHEVTYPTEAGSPSARVLISIEDNQQRFLPVALGIELPLPYRGLYLVDAPGSPLDDNPPGFYLFSAPARPVTAGIAVVRAHLLDQATRQPAAYAMLEVRVQSGGTWYGLADARGVVVVMFPYPTFLSTLDTSPPVPNPVPLNQQNWSLQVSVRYAPDTLVATVLDMPDLASISRQPPGLIWSTVTGPASNELLLNLIYGQELRLQTDGLPASEAATLLVSPATSPP